MSSSRQVRSGQRVAHLVAAVLLVGYVYVAPLLGGGFESAVRWVVVPAVVLSGMALWKWHRVRARLRDTRR